MDTFIMLFFLVGTCFFWIPVALCWGLIKSIGFLISAIFRSLGQSGSEAFGTAFTDLLMAAGVIFGSAFDVIINLWNWSDQNTTGSILLGIIGLFLVYRSLEHDEILAKVFFLAFVGFIGLAGVEMLLAAFYLAVSAIIEMYSNKLLFSISYVFLVLAIAFKFFAFLSDAMAERNIDRDKKVEAYILSQSRRSLLKFGETILFLAITFFFFAASFLIYNALRNLSEFVFS